MNDLSYHYKISLTSKLLIIMSETLNLNKRSNMRTQQKLVRLARTVTSRYNNGSSVGTVHWKRLPCTKVTRATLLFELPNCLFSKWYTASAPNAERRAAPVDTSNFPIVIISLIFLLKLKSGFNGWPDCSIVLKASCFFSVYNLNL